MRPSITSAFRGASYAQQTDQIFLALLEFAHPSLSVPIRIVNNYTNITSNGQEYIGFPFDLELPEDFEEALPEIRLSVCNVDRQIVQMIRTLTGPPTISVSVVLADDPNAVQVGPFVMTMRGADYDSMAVSGSVQSEDMLNEGYPGDSMSPANFPGLF
jgi:hypothetical protein